MRLCVNVGRAAPAVCLHRATRTDTDTKLDRAGAQGQSCASKYPRMRGADGTCSMFCKPGDEQGSERDTVRTIGMLRRGWVYKAVRIM